MSKPIAQKLFETFSRLNKHQIQGTETTDEGTVEMPARPLAWADLEPSDQAVWEAIEDKARSLLGVPS